MSSISDTEALASIENGHESMITVLSSRQKNLQIVRALYTGGNMKVRTQCIQREV